MSTKKKLLITSGVMIFVSIFMMFLLANHFFIPEPKLECVERSQPSSGFSDESQGGCPVSIESYSRYRDWEYPKYKRPIAIPSALLLLSGVVVGVVGLTRKSPKKQS